MIQSKHDQAQSDILTGGCLEVNRRRMTTHRYVYIGERCFQQECGRSDVCTTNVRPPWT